MTQSTPTSVLSLALEPKTAEDRVKLARGLAWLTSEDPAIAVKTDPASGGVVIFGAGEQHLEIIIDRLKREFDVEAWVGRPTVAYKETLTREADGEMKYVAEPDVRGDYAHVKLRLHPGAPG